MKLWSSHLCLWNCPEAETETGRWLVWKVLAPPAVWAGQGSPCWETTWMLAFCFLPLSLGNRSFFSSTANSSSESDSSSDVSSSPPKSLSDPLSSTSATSWQSSRRGWIKYSIAFSKTGVLHSPSLSPSELRPHALCQSVPQEPRPSAPAASDWLWPSEVGNSAVVPALKHSTTTHVRRPWPFCEESEVTVLTTAPGDSLCLQGRPGLRLQEKLLTQTWDSQKVHSQSHTAYKEHWRKLLYFWV